MHVYAGVFLRDFEGLQSCSQITVFYKCVVWFGVYLVGFFIFTFAPSSLGARHNSVENPVGFNCANCHLTKMH